MEPTDDREAMRRWVETWKRTGEELDRMKWEELRAMTEEDHARGFEMVSMHPRDCWLNPERRDGSGLVEQQRWFSKAYGLAPGHHRRA